MTILFMDGMDLYGATSNLSRRYDIVNSSVNWGAAFGRFGGGGIQVTADDLYFHKTLVGAPVEIIISFALFRSSTAAGGNDAVFIITNAGATELISWEPSAGSNIIVVNRGGQFGTQLGSFSIGLNEWHWVSMRYKASNTVGTYDIDVDGVNVFSFSGDTVNSGFQEVNTVKFGADNLQDWTYDDVIITDIAGSSPFNDILTDRRIDTIRPDATGDATDFTASPAVDNYLNVDDVTPDDDTTYVESGVSADKDLYNFGALGFSPGAIDVVNVVGLVRNPDAGTTEFKMKVKSGTTEGDGSSQTPSATYKYLDDNFLVNPDTASAWTESEVNGMQAGQEIV